MHPGWREAGFGRSAAGLSLAFTAGVLLAQGLPTRPHWSWLTSALLWVVLRWPGRWVWGAMLAGMLVTVIAGERYLAHRWPAARHGETVAVTGRVVSLPAASSAEAPDTWRFAFEPLPGQDPALPERIRVSWYQAEQQPLAGQCWQFELRMRTPHGSLNPGGFDYEAWLMREHVGATASVKSAALCADQRGAPLWLSLRQRIRSWVESTVPAHPGSPLLLALTIGDDGNIGDDDWDAFRLTGTSHLVAISGFNIAIIALVGFGLGRGLGWLFPALCLRMPAQKLGWLFSGVAGLGYALLAGGDAPVMRAALMLAALVSAAMFDRLQRAFGVLCVVWVALLVVDPSQIQAPGLWLSFGAVAAIFFVSSGRLRKLSFWREAIRVQLALSLALVPLSLGFFGGTSALAPLINLVAVPVVGVLTPALLILMGLAVVFPAWATPLVGVGASAAWQLRNGLIVVAHWMQSGWLSATPSGGAVALACIGMLFLLAPRGVPLKPLGLLLLLPLWQWPAQPADGQMVVDVLDVGQGLSVLVRTHQHALLFDAGPRFDGGFDAGEQVVVPALRALGVQRLDLLIESHGDLDHAGGIGAVMQALPVAATLGVDFPRHCQQAEHWRWDGVVFDVLNPPAGSAQEPHENNDSCVLRIRGNFTALLPGDIEKEAESRLVQQYGSDLQADLLLAAHHGSRTSSTDVFLDAVRPRWVIHSAGWRSYYHHPHPSVVARLQTRHIGQAVTGDLGELQVLVTPDGQLRLSAWRVDALRWWNAAPEWVAQRQQGK